MTDPGPHLRVVAGDAAEAVAAASQSALTDLFHCVWSVIPGEQQIWGVSQDERAGVALSLMQEHGFSQLPVREGREVLGVFSYSSFSANACQVAANMRTPLRDVAVEAFMARPVWVSPNHEVQDLFDLLDPDGAVFVGTQQELLGVVTSVDVLRWLHNLAEPFVRLGEIERSLRTIVTLKMSTDQIAACAERALKSKYENHPEDLPSALEEMTFDELRLLVVSKRNWDLLTNALGANRELAAVRLKRLPKLRNNVFHFRQQLERADREEIEQTRTWLQCRLRALQAQAEPT